MKNGSTLFSSIHTVVSRAIMTAGLVSGLCLTPLFAQQLLISNGAFLNNGTGTITVNGNIVNNGSFTNTGAGIINLAGDWQNNGSYTSASETVSFLGTAAQNITGSSATTFNNLTLDNIYGLSLSGNSNAGIEGQLTLVNGRCSLGSKNLILGTDATISIASPSVATMIVPDGTGKLIKDFGTSGVTTFFFPV